MPSIPARLRSLLGTSAGTRRDVLRAALRHAEPDEERPLCEALAPSADAPAAADIVARLHRLDPTLADALIRGPAPLAAVAAEVIERRDDIALSNLIDLIRARPAAGLAAPLGRIISLAEPSIAAEAAEALLETTQAVVGEHGRRACRHAERADLERAVIMALEQPSGSRLPPVAIAGALLAVRPGPLLADRLAMPDDPICFALRAAADQLRRAPVRRNLLRWLGDETLGAAAARALHRITDLDTWADVLARGHLLLSPLRRTALRQADRPVRCLPDLATAAALPAPAQAWLPHLIAGLDLSAGLRARRIAELVALPHPIARWRVLQKLQGFRTPEALAAVGALSRDRTGFIAGAAADDQLGDPVRAAAETIRSLSASGHPAIAARARRELCCRDVDALVRHWRHLEPLDRLAAGYRLVQEEPAAVADGLRRILGHPERGMALPAIELARRLRLVDRLEHELLDLCAHDDARLASAALGALAGRHDPACMRTMREALDHADARVRANALEAFARTAPAAEVPVIRAFARSHENRTRGNAVRALMRTRQPDAMVELKMMLDDVNPLQRISGLWVARRSRQPGVEVEVRRLAASDELPEVRSRAVAALRFLTAPALAPPRSGEVSG